MFNPLKIKALLDAKKTDKKFRQIDFLEDIDMTLTGVKNIIEGKSQPKIDTLEKMAKYFGVDMNYFFDDFDSKTSILKSPEEPYNIDKKNPWQLLYEKQIEITELKLEIEHIKKEHAGGCNAQCG